MVQLRSQGVSQTPALSAAFFHDEAAAFAKLERPLRPEGPVCPHCGGMGRITAVKGVRMGLRRCGDCKKQFTVTNGVTSKTAWFVAHRLREALRDDAHAPLDSDGGVAEVDETFIGHGRTVKPEGEKKGWGYHHKRKVLSLVDRDTGQKRSMIVDDLSAQLPVPILRDDFAKETRV